MYALNSKTTFCGAVAEGLDHMCTDFTSKHTQILSQLLLHRDNEMIFTLICPRKCEGHWNRNQHCLEFTVHHPLRVPPIRKLIGICWKSILGILCFKSCPSLLPSECYITSVTVLLAAIKTEGEKGNFSVLKWLSLHDVGGKCLCKDSSNSVS